MSEFDNSYALFICKADAHGAGNSWGIVGLKCRVLTSTLSLQCCETAGLWIPYLNSQQ